MPIWKICQITCLRVLTVFGDSGYPFDRLSMSKIPRDLMTAPDWQVKNSLEPSKIAAAFAAVTPRERDEAISRPTGTGNHILRFQRRDLQDRIAHQRGCGQCC